MVWNDMKNYVRSRYCKTSQEVVDTIEDYRQNLTPEKCQKFIRKIKEVIKKIIENKGGWSNF